MKGTQEGTYFLLIYFLYFLRRKRLDGRPRFRGKNSSSSGPLLDEGSLFSESDWLIPCSTAQPFDTETAPFSSPEELASSGVSMEVLV